MIHALLLTAAALPPATEPDALQPRAGAARTLRAALEGAPGGLGLSTGISAARAAVEELGPGAFSVTLEESVVDARWRALFDPTSARERLERDLRAALDDLVFRPVREAELPAGFPEPTPVREIELKTYPKYRMVRAGMQGRRSSGAFWKLFGHIKRNDIAMTAPVETTYAENGETWEETGMAFLYGSPDMGEPGRAGEVEVIDVEPGRFLSIGCRGRMNRASLQAARARLMAWVERQDELEVAGELRSLGYNSPMVPDARRYFEVQLPMRKRTGMKPSDVVIDFAEEDAASLWSPVNDGVMGGLSSSRFVPTGRGTCVFEGRVSLENNGGFASVRTRPADLGLQGTRALRLAFRGDGKSYKLRLRTSDAFDGVNYEVAFATEDGVWQERSFAIAEFVPVWRGRRVRDADELVPEDVRGVGFLISDEQTGPFRLEVARLSKE